MKPVISGLMLPYEVRENQPLYRERERSASEPREKTRRGLNSVLKKASNFLSALRREERSLERKRSSTAISCRSVLFVAPRYVPKLTGCHSVLISCPKMI